MPVVLYPCVSISQGRVSLSERGGARAHREDRGGVEPDARHQLGLQLHHLHAQGRQVQARPLQEARTTLQQELRGEARQLSVRVSQVRTTLQITLQTFPLSVTMVTVTQYRAIRLQ